MSLAIHRGGEFCKEREEMIRGLGLSQVGMRQQPESTSNPAIVPYRIVETVLE